MREMINLYQFLSLWVSTCMLKLLSRWLMDKTWYFRHLTTARQWVCSLLHKNSTYIEAVSQVRTADILGAAAWVKQRDERQKLKREKNRKISDVNIGFLLYQITQIAFNQPLPSALITHPSEQGRKAVKALQITSLITWSSVQHLIAVPSPLLCCSGAC